MERAEYASFISADALSVAPQIWPRTGRFCRPLLGVRNTQDFVMHLEGKEQEYPILRGRRCLVGFLRVGVILEL